MTDMPKEIWAIDNAKLEVCTIWSEEPEWRDEDCTKYIRADLIEELKSIAQKAHNRGIPIDGATILFLIKEYFEEGKENE